MIAAQRTFDCDDLRREIFSYLGKPLPPDEHSSHSFNCSTYKIYYRKNGRIRHRFGQKLMKCMSCKAEYWSTGYSACSSCFEKWGRDWRKFGRKFCPNETENPNCSFFYKGKQGYTHCYSCSQLNRKKPLLSGYCMIDSDSD